MLLVSPPLQSESSSPNRPAIKLHRTLDDVEIPNSTRRIRSQTENDPACTPAQPRANPWQDDETYMPDPISRSPAAPDLRRQQSLGLQLDRERAQRLEDLWRKTEGTTQQNQDSSARAEASTMPDRIEEMEDNNMEGVSGNDSPSVADRPGQNTPDGSPRSQRHTSQSSPIPPAGSMTSQQVIEEQRKELLAMKEHALEMERKMLQMERQQMEVQRGIAMTTSGAAARATPTTITGFPRRELPASIRGPPLTTPLTEVGPENTHGRARDRPRAKAPSVFNPPKDDLRFWILEMEDYFVNDGLADTRLQASTARNYLSDPIKKRITYARIYNDVKDTEKFMEWVPLKNWLFEEYGKQHSSLEADMKMNRCKMFDNQSVQDFNNYFESILQDVSWGFEEHSILSHYRLKLTKPILERIYSACQGILPDTYAGMKEQALRAEEYIRTTNSLFGKPQYRQERPERRVEFNLPPRSDNTIKIDTTPRGDTPRPNSPRRPLQDNNGNPRKRKETMYPDIPQEERKRLRDAKLCFNCKKPNHFTKDCPHPKAEPSRR